MVGPQENETGEPFSLDDPRENIKKLVDHEDVILERKTQIKKAIVSVVESEETYNASSRIFTNVEIAVSGSQSVEKYDDEDWDNLGEALVGFVHTLIMKDAEMLELIENEGASAELQDFIIDLMLECGEELQRLNFYQIQGKNWWSFIRTDRVVESNAIKHKHMITVDRRRDVEIDSAPYSDWVLVGHFLNEILEAYSQERVQLEDILDVNQLNQVRARVYAFEEAIKDSDLEIQLPGREQLIGDQSEVEQEDG